MRTYAASSGGSPRASIPKVDSAASLFVSRWDVAVKDKVPHELRNRLGIAIAKRTYKAYRELLASPRWRALEGAGARVQRLLWASTGTKDPEAPDTLYIEALAAPDTINTIPDKTLLAFADHGQVSGALPVDGGDAEHVIDEFRRGEWTTQHWPISFRSKARKRSTRRGTTSSLASPRKARPSTARRLAETDPMAGRNTRRPVFLDLVRIQMPVGALTSITHRVTGILLALGIPFGIYILDQSLQAPESYTWLISLFDQWAFKASAIVLIWALAHHLLAGIRHLLSDIDIGSLLPAARRSAWIVNVGGLLVALLAAGALL